MKILGIFLALAAAMAAPAGAQTPPIKIGVVTTLTGGGAVIGRDVVDAVNLGVEHIGGSMGGRKVEIVYEDDGLKPELGRQKTQKLIQQDGVDVLGGYIWSNVLLASRKPIVDAGKVVVSVNAGPSDIAGKLCYENFIAMHAQNDVLPMAVGKLMNLRGAKKLYFMAPNYTAGKDFLQAVRRVYTGEVVGADMTRWGDDPQLDFSAELSKVRASGADALFAFYPGAAGAAFARQFDQSGLAGKTKLFTAFTLDQLNLPSLQAAGVKGVLGSETADFWAADLDNAENKRFVKEFNAKYGRLPSNYAATSYDMVTQLKAAVDELGGNTKEAAKLSAALRKAAYRSVRGVQYRIGKNGFPVDRFVAFEVDGSGPVWSLKSKEVVLEGTADPHLAACPL